MDEPAFTQSLAFSYLSLSNHRIDVRVQINDLLRRSFKEDKKLVADVFSNYESLNINA